ncbi:DUF4180 domain-containing protein [Nonomuraea phyllanthi]|uniref:DUF4180 domain-containing protein n=1 Tax=Nonomuraea phyllanthi TaxID=2219224 RepID=UPI001293E0EF|nr:DUF4180 domain-containing protein [Nonomuraea phyllanthi]QFY10506.1 DUF4180 domain-containing protein [Nonomuraea phyllanthi]
MHDDRTIHVLEPDGAPLRETQDALDLIGEAFGSGVRWVAIPVERLHEDFFALRTGVAGEIAQKFVNYGIGLAVVGDVSRFTATGTALRDWVRESNRGRHVWFVADLEELAARRAAYGI